MSSPDTGYAYRVYRVVLLGYVESSNTSIDFFVQNSYGAISPGSGSGGACYVRSDGDFNGWGVTNSYGLYYSPSYGIDYRACISKSDGDIDFFGGDTHFYSYGVISFIYTSSNICIICLNSNNIIDIISLI